MPIPPVLQQHNPAPVSNPYVKKPDHKAITLTQKALRQCASVASSNSSTTRSTDREIRQLHHNDEISVRRTRRRLVYKRDRLTYSVEPSTSLQECTIDKTLENMKNCLYLDDFRLKHDGDFRFILQNPRGIKEFRNDNPEYLPTMQALKRGTK